MIPKISKDKTVLEILKNYPEARTVFDRYSKQYGGCITCTALFSTIQELAVIRGIPLDQILTDLNEAVAGL
ncbi:MAG: hypothetical protein QMC81_09560 [Thermoanaerobacterales bacterium]|nr:hypothetical protein [Thermoanaerobacterales bacterium]